MMKTKLIRASYSCVCCEKIIGFCQDYMIVGGEFVCPTCYEWQTFRCTCCMEDFFDDEACYDEEDFPYCEKCFEALRADEEDDEELAVEIAV